MNDTIQISLTSDEVEILVDALEADMEGYVEAAKEARGNGNRADVETFTDAATRIQKLMAKLQDVVQE